MHDARTSCQLPHPRTGDSSQKSTHPDDTPCPHTSRDTHPETPTLETVFEYSGSAGNLVRGATQELEHTQSRRSGPRRWLRAVTWLIAAGLHPRAGATTLRLAEDLAARMDYDTGHVIYDLDRTAARLGVDRATVKRHAKYLRELGTLVWASHGTQHNSRRARGLSGYAGTATIYAAAIPPVYDHAMGHRIVGTGYAARIVIDQRSQTPTQEQPEPVDNSGADEGRAPLSLTVVKEVGQVQVVGGCKDTPRKRASRQTASTPHPKTASNNGQPHRSPLQAARDIRIASQVRPRVNWTQTEGLRRLAFALRLLIDRGLDADQIVAELHSWWLDWRPAKPASYIRAQLARQAAQGSMATAPQAMTDAEWDAYREQRAEADRAAEEQQAAESHAERADRTDEDRRIAREYGWHDGMFDVARHYEEDPEDALDLYGLTLCTRAVRMTSSTAFAQGAAA